MAIVNTLRAAWGAVQKDRRNQRQLRDVHRGAIRWHRDGHRYIGENGYGETFSMQEYPEGWQSEMVHPERRVIYRGPYQGAASTAAGLESRCKNRS